MCSSDLNRPISEEHYDRLRARLMAYVAERDLYAQDMYIGADPAHRRSLRVYTETAWASIFARNLFRRPPLEDLASFQPNFRIINGTGTPTTNLVATLLTGNGVIAPTGAQTYGAVAPGGEAVRAFSFTVDGSVSPNGQVTATLQLQDGATNLGTLPFVFSAGPAPCGIPRIISTWSVQRLDPATVRATIKLQNIGAVTAQNVQLGTVKLGTVVGVPSTTTLGDIAAGGEAPAVTVDFATATSGTSSLSISGSFTGDTFGSVVRVTIPAAPLP